MAPSLLLGLTAAVAMISPASSSAILPRHEYVSFRGPASVEADGMSNIHVTYNVPVDGQLSLHYGGCDSPLAAEKDSHHHVVGHTNIGSNPLARRNAEWKDSRPEKFVWLVPGDVPDAGCLHAYAGDNLVGKSEPISVTKRNARRSVVLGDIGDAEGPWFDGVQYLQDKEPSDVFVSQTKSKTVGILGGGMSGLMSAHLLDSVGFHDWKIIEASSRLGGRVHTAYLDDTTPNQYQYQEMGPMRFPLDIWDSETNQSIPINDHKMVFQLADTLNQMNGQDPEYKVNFIEFVQNNPNTPADTSKRINGHVPTIADTNANASLADNKTATYSNVSAVNEAMAAVAAWKNESNATLKAVVEDVFTAHKNAVKHGLLDFSESGYLRYKLKINPDIADQVDSIGDNYDSWYYDDGYFDGVHWLTIDQGLNRLPQAFGPLVQNRTQFDTRVQGLKYNSDADKISVEYRPHSPYAMEPESMEFDYVMNSVPFSLVRLWRLPDYSSLLSRAINTLNYEQVCKVALHYKTRFWEHLDEPIYGGCGTVDIPGVGDLCYPSYNINSTDPGVVLASYLSGIQARTTASMSEEDHVALVQRAMVEIHGDVAHEEYSGSYDRMCWETNENQAGAWCQPLAGQQDLYLPAYFKTEKKSVFIGEHTSYTHAWIFSALESAVRGTTQLLLDMGLVDEAKQVTNEWMARWMKV